MAGSILTIHWTALHCTELHCAGLQCAALHCTVLHYTTLHRTALHCTTLRCTELHCTALHYNHWPTLQCAALRCTALHCTALHCPPIEANCKKWQPTKSCPGPRDWAGGSSLLHWYIVQFNRVHCTLYIVQCTVHCVHLRLYSVQNTVYMFTVSQAQHNFYLAPHSPVHLAGLTTLGETAGTAQS